MKEDITLQHCLSLAGCIHKMIPATDKWKHMGVYDKVLIFIDAADGLVPL